MSLYTEDMERWMEKSLTLFQAKKYPEAIECCEWAYRGLKAIPEEVREHLKKAAEYYLNEGGEWPKNYDEVFLDLGDLLLEFPPPHSWPDEERAELAYGLYNSVKPELLEDRQTWMAFYANDWEDEYENLNY